MCRVQVSKAFRMIRTSSVLPISEGFVANLSTAQDTMYLPQPLTQLAQVISLMDSVAALPPALAPARYAATEDKIK